MPLLSAKSILPGPAGERIRDGAVLVDGDTIRAVGTRAELAAHAGDGEHLDFPELTMLPGLVNAHVHLAFDATADWYTHLSEAADSDLALGMAGRAQQALTSGVTTVRDLGDRNGLAIRVRDAVRRGELAGPRVLSACSPITVPHGHCWFLGGEAATPYEMRARVEEHAAAGADLIKVMASGGSVTPNSPPMWQSQFGVADLRTVTAAAHAAGLPVAAHAHGTQSIVDAVAAGVDTIEHATWIAEGGGGTDLRAETARAIVDQGIVVCPGWPADWEGFAERLGPDRAKNALDRMRWMVEQGVTLIPGTDAGLRGSTFHSYANALGLYQEIGYSNAGAIELATTTAASALGQDGETGRLAAGHVADLILVRGDPFEDLSHLSRVEHVLHRGTRIR